MSKFKVGEIAILQNCFHHENNGKECEIISDRMCRQLELGVPIDSIGQYMIITNGRKFCAKEISLKKLPPKDDQSSWEDMKDIFIPKGVEA